MKSNSVIVRWNPGLHLRPATRLVRLAQRFRSRLLFKAGGHVADARSIFQVLLLSASLGTTMIIEVDGQDESEALQAVTELFADDDPAATEET